MRDSVPNTIRRSKLIRLRMPWASSCNSGSKMSDSAPLSLSWKASSVAVSRQLRGTRVRPSLAEAMITSMHSRLL